MEKICMSKEQLRKFLVIYQGLHYPKPFKGYTGIKEFVKKGGCLQYDPLNVVSKRKYGYYVLPVLCGDRIIARFEPEIHREDAPLVIKNWWWEDRDAITDEVISEVIHCFVGFCSFLKSSGLSDESYKMIVRK